MEVKRVKVENEELRKFPCKLCPYQGIRFDNLNRHVRSVHAKIRSMNVKIVELTFHKKFTW